MNIKYWTAFTSCYTEMQPMKESNYILEIKGNATHVLSISFQHGLFHQNFVFIRQLYFTYSIKISFFVLIDCKYSLFKSTCSQNNLSDSMKCSA